MYLRVVFSCKSSVRTYFAIESRVTKLGAFSPFGRLFSLGSLFKNYRSSENSLSTFYHDASYVLILTKTGWATLESIFFTNSSDSSGHPD
jgi:hypothetical protein